MKAFPRPSPAGLGRSRIARLTGTIRRQTIGCRCWRFPAHHDTLTPKRLLNNVVLPAGQTQAQDLAGALDSIFLHPNVGPFIGRQLIQRLVTSNPSPAYVYRVAQAFADNGQGVRGDLKAVIRAILLDYEARAATLPTGTFYGHQREPTLRLANLYRAFGASAASGKYAVGNQTNTLGQTPLYAPSVFNFYSPDYTRRGAIAEAGLVAPEFQITTTSQAITSANKMQQRRVSAAVAHRTRCARLRLSAR